MIGSTGLAGVSGSTGRGVGAVGFGTSANGGFATGVRDCCVVLHEMTAKLNSGTIVAKRQIRRLNLDIPYLQAPLRFTGPFVEKTSLGIP